MPGGVSVEVKQGAPLSVLPHELKDGLKSHPNVGNALVSEELMVGKC